MAAPKVYTEGAANITNTKATLVGLCASRGGILTVGWFEHRSKEIDFPVSSDSVDVPEDWRPFAVDVPVHETNWINSFRAVLANADGTVRGDWVKFWVPPKAYEYEAPPFYISQREVEWEDRDMTLWLWSDIPIELFLHVGVGPPWKKRGFHFKRGRIFHHSPQVYWAWRWNIEQREYGDVKLHSFVIPFPPKFNTLWIQARGYVEGRISPSRSPFFRYQYSPSLLDLGIYSQPDVLENNVLLEAGGDIVLSYDRPTNTIKITKSGSHHRRRRRPGRPPGPPRPP